jgi:6-pyruvoyltetrahydropterin/6-carboxytetrahydropterin synthase
LTLSRSLRFLIPEPGAGPGNGWTGGPLGPAATWAGELELVVAGEVDPGSGFLCDIKAIDAVLRQAVQATGAPLAGWFPWLHAVAAELRSLVLPARPERLTLRLGRGIALSLDPTRESPMRYTEQFEFSAAHRLHVDALSDEANRALFGKCNNPNGHGHNYVVEVTVAAGEPGAAGPLPTPVCLAEVVRREVIDRYDHRHLNLDVPDYATLNPTVENITDTIFRRLAATPELGAHLLRVRVHETAKTWAEVVREDY